MGEEMNIKCDTFEATGDKGQINLNKVMKYTENILEYERNITKVNMGSDGISCESKGKSVIKTEILVENENTTFDRENVENDIKIDVEENIKKEMKEDPLKVENAELEMVYTHNVDLDGLCCETKDNNVIKTEIIFENENTIFDRENVEEDIKTDVDETTMKIEINENSLNQQNEKSEVMYEQNGKQTKQNDFERLQDASISSQLIIKNTNPTVTHQVLSDKILAYNCRYPEVTMYKCQKGCLKTNTNRLVPDLKVYTCKSCSYVTQRKDHLKRHMLIHESSEITLHHCYECSFKTKYKNYLKTHMLIHRSLTEVKVYTCKTCSYATGRKDNFKRHMLSHEEITLYHCHLCSYESRYKQGLKTHMLTHEQVSELTLYNCDLCTFKTKYKYYLKTHMLSHQDLSEVTTYKCNSCSYVTKHKRDLNTHTRIHLGLSEVKVFNCFECSFKTIHKKSLETHVLIHREISYVTLYNCDRCSFKTKYKHYLKTHKLTHRDSEATVYNCEQCSFNTKHKISLKRHMLTHQKLSKVEAYSCETCSYVTKVKAYLRSHMKVHQSSEIMITNATNVLLNQNMEIP